MLSFVVAAAGLSLYPQTDAGYFELKTWWWNSPHGPHAHRLDLEPSKTVSMLRKTFGASEPQLARYMHAVREHAKTYSWREGAYQYGFCHFYQNALQRVVDHLDARAPATADVEAVRAFYEEHAPARVAGDADLVERVLRQNHGTGVEVLLRRLRQKYAAPPPVDTTQVAVGAAGEVDAAAPTVSVAPGAFGSNDTDKGWEASADELTLLRSSLFAQAGAVACRSERGHEAR